MSDQTQTAPEKQGGFRLPVGHACLEPALAAYQCRCQPPQPR